MRPTNREDVGGESRPVDMLRTLYLVAKLVVLGTALLLLLVALGFLPRRRAAFAL